MKEYIAIAKYIRYSPYKLRPIVDVVRGKRAQSALNWLSTYAGKRVLPISKVIASAVANAKSLDGQMAEELVVKDIRVDQGPMHRYFRPGAMGRAQVQCRRTCHIRVILEDAQSIQNN